MSDDDTNDRVVELLQRDCFTIIETKFGGSQFTSFDEDGDGYELRSDFAEWFQQHELTLFVTGVDDESIDYGEDQSKYVYMGAGKELDVGYLFVGDLPQTEQWAFGDRDKAMLFKLTFA